MTQKNALEHAMLLAEAAIAAGVEDCETWHLRSDELWLFVLIYIRDHSADPEAQRLAHVALRPRSDTSGWYA